MKNRSFIFGIVLSTLLFPSVSFAATLHLEPQASVLGTQNDFSIVVLLDADQPINTIGASIVFPKTLEPQDIEIGESIVNLWVEKPTWNETTRTLTFSGVIPGGFVGTDGPLVTIDCAVLDPNASVTVSFDPNATVAYLSDGKATPDPLTLENLTLPVAIGKENIAPIIPDTTPPEAFTPEISRDESIFNDQWFLSFSTEDKGSGVASYGVREERHGIFGVISTAWQPAESPYLLKDQTLQSEIDVEAIDKAGNVRIEVIPARFPLPWYESAAFWIIIIIAFLLYAVVRSQKKGKIS